MQQLTHDQINEHRQIVKDLYASFTETRCNVMKHLYNVCLSITKDINEVEKTIDMM